jgi:hypothetical protein
MATFASLARKRNPDFACSDAQSAEKGDLVKSLLGATLFLLAGALSAQTTNILIYDSAGNQAIGTISNGNVYFNDSNGKNTFGTIRNGNIFLTTSKGEITFGTIRNGNVFLTDEKGVTTGTIRDGNIFLNNSDGSTTTGTYDRNGAATTTTGTGADTPAPATSEPHATPSSRASDYQAGYAVGQALGNGILTLRLEHAINGACFNKHAEGWRLPDGSTILCTNWSAVHPHEMKGTPQNVGAEAAGTVNNLCSANPRGWYKVQLSGLWYSYSCKEWRKQTTK